MRSAARRGRPLLFAFAVACTLTACGPSPDSIIVSGASGQLGGLVVEELLARGVEPERLILVSRTPETLEHYAEIGASTRFGDFSQPESLAAAYEGGDRMLLISIDTGVGEGRADLHKNAIDAAVAAGVRHIAYTSFVDLDNNDSPLADDHRRTEQLLRESGVAWTMLRNSLYANGLVTRAARMLADGQATAAYTGGVAYVTREDCAAAAAAVLATDGHENRAYDITGPEVVLPQDVARIASEITGVTITVVEPEPEEPARAIPGSASFAVVSTAVRDLTGRPAQTVRDLLDRNRAALFGPVR